MRDIPETITIAGRDIKIVWKDFEETYGQYVHDKREIHLARRIQDSEAMVWQTLYHELVHAALGMAGLDHVLGDDNEEAVVRCIEHLLFPVFDKIRPPRGFTKARP